ncbi:hypothetical protein KP509_08G071600 [Ceratopteris richardii]|nr:hypothetical protein KP509_08G071600 [Ceratopteris richardii]KAH7431890.1 hypothetical protein KP509_08G071600 [Ceratopteris richardii]
MKLFRNSRGVQLQKMKRDIASLLETNQEKLAHVKVEQVHKEQKIVAAYEIIELFCELIAARLSIIEANKQCPIDMREPVASIIYAAPRCPEITELQQIRCLLSRKYGKEFTQIADELRPDCGVNRVIIEKLSVKKPSIDLRLELMKAIANECNLDWTPSLHSLKPPDDLDGISNVIAASHGSCEEPVDSISTSQHDESILGVRIPSDQSITSVGERQFIPFLQHTYENAARLLPDSQSPSQTSIKMSGVFIYPSSSSTTSSEHSKIGSPLLGDQFFSQVTQTSRQTVASHESKDRSIDHRNERRATLKNAAYAVQKIAVSAERAVEAARTAAMIVEQNLKKLESDTDDDDVDDDDARRGTSDIEHLEWQAAVENTGHEPRMELHVDIDNNHSEPIKHLPFNKNVQRKSSFENPMDQHGNIASRSNFSMNDSGAIQSVINAPSTIGRRVLKSSSQSHKISSFDVQKTSVDPIFNQDKWGEEALHSVSDQHATGARQLPHLAKSMSFVHPKLPDSDEFFAHFRALKASKSRK